MYGMAYANCSSEPNEGGQTMGYLIDAYYLFRELFKLLFMVLISPLGLAAGFFLSWQ